MIIIHIIYFSPDLFLHVTKTTLLHQKRICVTYYQITLHYNHVEGMTKRLSIKKAEYVLIGGTERVV